MNSRFLITFIYLWEQRAQRQSHEGKNYSKILQGCLDFRIGSTNKKYNKYLKKKQGYNVMGSLLIKENSKQ